MHRSISDDASALGSDLQVACYQLRSGREEDDLFRRPVESLVGLPARGSLGKKVLYTFARVPVLRGRDKLLGHHRLVFVTTPDKLPPPDLITEQDAGTRTPRLR